MELAWFEGVSSVSPFLTGGVQFFLKPFFIDIPVAVVFHEYDSDTDISLLAGVYFEL